MVEAFEQDAQKVNERLIELAGIEEGYRVLDIATGTGEPAITAIKKVGDKVMFWLLTYISTDVVYCKAEGQLPGSRKYYRIQECDRNNWFTCFV